MKDPDTADVLEELRDILRKAIGLCSASGNAPEALQAELIDYTLLHFGIDEVVHLAQSLRNLHDSAGKDSRLLKRYARAARLAFEDIQDALKDQPERQSTSRQTPRTVNSRKEVAFFQTRLSRVVAAINSTALLAAMRLKHTQTHRLVQKLDTLISSCQHSTNCSAQSDIVGRHTDSHSSITRTEPSTYVVENRIRQLLRPSNVAYLSSELRLAYSYAGTLAYGRRPSSANVQVLNTNLIGWLLEEPPSCPPNYSPELASHISDAMMASRRGDVDKMSEVFSKNRSLQYSYTIANLTPMFFAIESGSLLAVQYLTNNGVRINDAFGRNRTVPLAAALQFRHLHLVKYLINSGASFQHRSFSGWSPMWYLWFKPERNPSASEFLTLLWSSPHFEDLHRDVYDDNGWAIMHRATVHGAAEDLVLLIRYDVDPFASTKKPKADCEDSEYDSFSVLQLAVHYGHFDAFQILLPYYFDKFGNVDLPDNNGWTLLHVATNLGHIDIARMLIEWGADMDAKTGPTSSGKPGDKKKHRYTPASLAADLDSESHDQFRALFEDAKQASHHIPICHDMASTRPVLPYGSAHALVPHLKTLGEVTHASVSTRSIAQAPELGMKRRKSYDSTSVSDNSRAHLGDVYIKHYHSTKRIQRARHPINQRLKVTRRRLKITDYG